MTPGIYYFTNQWGSFPVVKACDISFIDVSPKAAFISVTPLMFGPNCNYIPIFGYAASMLASLLVTKISKLLIYWGHSLSVWTKLLAQHLAWLWSKHDPRYLLLYCNQWGSFPVVKACDNSFLYRCILCSNSHPKDTAIWCKHWVFKIYLPIRDVTHLTSIKDVWSPTGCSIINTGGHVHNQAKYLSLVLQCQKWMTPGT